jgi:hypothetical protein
MGQSTAKCPGQGRPTIPFLEADRRRAIRAKGRSVEVLTANELTSDPVFAGIPPKFLLWQRGLVIRRRVRAGQLLCRQGEPGNTAFILREGRVKVTIRPRPPRSGRAPMFMEADCKRARAGRSNPWRDGLLKRITARPQVTASEDGEVWRFAAMCSIG